MNRLRMLMLSYSFLHIFINHQKSSRGLEIIVFIANKSSFLFTIFSINPRNNENLGLKVNIKVGNVLLDQGVQLK